MIGLDREVLAAGTTLVRTDSLNLLLAGGPGTLADGAIVALDGPPGCGKTTALAQLVHEVDSAFVTVSLDPRSTDKDVVRQVHEAVVGTPVTSRTNKAEMANEVRCELARQSRLLCIDEAQNASVSAIEMIRQLQMDPTANFGLVLSGAGLNKKLKSEQMLHSRVGQWVHFAPISAGELPRVLHGLHPLLATLDDDLLIAADDHTCHGVLRSWVNILRFLRRFTPAGAPASKEGLEQAIFMLTSKSVDLAA